MTEDYDEYDDEYGTCSGCGDGDFEMARSACIDDLCRGGEVPCMHGDLSMLPCPLCGRIPG